MSFFPLKDGDVFGEMAVLAKAQISHGGAGGEADYGC